MSDHDIFLTNKYYMSCEICIILVFPVQAADISEELTTMQNNLEAVISANPSPSDQQIQQLAANVTVMSRSQAIRKLEELLSKKQALDCVLYLRSMRCVV